MVPTGLIAPAASLPLLQIGRPLRAANQRTFNWLVRSVSRE
jgi:hypothetical protein